jgi:hypothetical protein
MALLQPESGDPGLKRATTESVGAPEVEDRLVRDGRQIIARGSLVCGECGLPLPGSPAVSIALALACGWCGHSAPAREFFRAEVRDAPASAVEMVARLFDDERR